MDGIESITMPPTLSPLSLEQIQKEARSERSAHEAVAALEGRSEQEKQRLAKSFESVLLTRLFDQVKQSVGGWGLEEDGASKQIQGLFWYYLAQDVGDKGGFGLWQDIYQSFKALEDAGATGESIDREL